MTILLNVTDQDRIDAFKEVLGRDCPDIGIVTSDDPYDAQDIRYIFTWRPLDDWSVFSNLEVVFSVSAGVDQFDTLPEEISLVKMVDPNNAERVVDYVLMACLACLRDVPRYATDQRRQVWDAKSCTTVRGTEVGILGMGEIGQQAARVLTSVGFSVSGWARSPRVIEGISCTAGEDGLSRLLERSDVVVCLLPLTKETRGILSRSVFERMKPGTGLVHAGRGAQCVFPDLAQALESGQLGNAVVDVFETEPLPEDDPIWTLPNLLITPHVAGRTSAQTAAQNVATNLKRIEEGQELLWRVDRAKGY